jgi:hypothetical protein
MPRPSPGQQPASVLFSLSAVGCVADDAPLVEFAPNIMTAIVLA